MCQQETVSLGATQAYRETCTVLFALCAKRKL